MLEIHGAAPRLKNDKCVLRSVQLSQEVLERAQG
jgi:hypothetical protein